MLLKHKNTIAFIILLLIVTQQAFAFGNECGLYNSQIKYRSGLGNTFKNLNNKNQIKIAYLGGSITEANSGWRDFTTHWFQENFPLSNIEEINAAIGGTGSDLGAFRLNEHVLKHNPDLIFVEFAVNDYGRNFSDIINSIEGIVRQIIRHNKTSDICFVYTLCYPMLQDYSDGNVPTSISAMEAVAEYYRIPSINFGPNVITQLNAKKMSFMPTDSIQSLPVFANDGVHPSEHGYKVYSETMKYALTEFSACKQNQKYKLPKAMSSKNLEKARMITLNNSNVKKYGKWKTSGFPFNKSDFSKYYPNIYYISDSTSYLIFKFKGTIFGIADIIGPSSSRISITIDGKEKEVDRFDSYSSYYRIHYYMIRNLAKTHHEVKVKIHPNLLNKQEIMKTDITKNTEYDSHNYYIGYLMIAD